MPLSQKQKEDLQLKWLKQDNADIADAAKALMVTDKGRKYLWWLLQIGKVGVQPFTPNALNTSFNCGELNVGQQILAHLIEVDPSSYVRMQQEQADERNKRNNALRGNPSDGDSGETVSD